MLYGSWLNEQGYNELGKDNVMKVKKSKISWRTTAIGGFALLLFLLGIALVYFGKATLTEVGTFSGLIMPALLAIYGLVSKDAKVQSLTNAEVETIEKIVIKEDKK